MYRLFCLKEIFLNIYVLSQFIVYWTHFQDIHTFTCQKPLLHTLFCLFLKSSKAFSVSLTENFMFSAVVKHWRHERKAHLYTTLYYLTFQSSLKCNAFIRTPYFPVIRWYPHSAKIKIDWWGIQMFLRITHHFSLVIKLDNFYKW